MAAPTTHPRPARSTPAGRLGGALAALLLGLGVLSGCAVGDAGPATTAGADAASSSSPSSPSVPAAPASPAAVAARVGSVLPEEPVSVTLPSGTRVPVQAVSTTDNGVLDVPEDIDQAGWWRGGSRIGDPFGSTLVAAHVDSRTQGLGPFAELLSVRPGAEVTVVTDGLRQRFRVDSLRLRPKGSIGPRSALHSPAGERRLTLVTCAGPYVPELGGYQDLAVVVATPLEAPVERAAR